jgi:hypothetical protein
MAILAGRQQDALRADSMKNLPIATRKHEPYPPCNRQIPGSSLGVGSSPDLQRIGIAK